MKKKLLFSLFLIGTTSVFLFSVVSYLSVANPKQNIFYELNSNIPAGALHSFLGSLPFFQPYPSKKQVMQQTQAISQPPLEDVTSGENVFATGKDLNLNNLQIQGGLITEGVAQFDSGIITNGSNIDAGTGIIKASNILYGVTAGNGISVGTGQDPLISNTGVLSLQNQTGALSLSAGSGIGINGLTISNNDAGSSQNIFKNIGISGQSTITAGSNNDTLSFVAGSGINLTTDGNNKFITITNSATNSASAGGWTESTGSIIEQNLTDYVGIGTANPTAALDIAGSASISGNLAFTGGGTQKINLFNNSSLGYYYSVQQH
jgi:hypothetical protein